MAKVQVRLPSHIAKLIDAKSSSWLAFEKDIGENTTVRTLLSSLASTYPGFRETMYNPDVGLVNEQVGVVLNDRLLTFEEISQIKLSDSDTILLIPLYFGG